MTTRREAAARRQALLLDLTAAIARGDLAPGDRVDSGGDLARRYELSKPVVAATLTPLIDDGTLRIVPSVGTFVAASTHRANGTYVLVVSPEELGWLSTHPTATGFEERITLHGGRSVVTDTDTFLGSDLAGTLMPLLGLFVLSGGRVDELADAVDDGVPIVVYASGSREPLDAEVGYVDVENVIGGRLAATELLSSGFSSVAFVGIHRAGSELHPWSRERAEGWEQVVRRSNPRAPLLRIEPRWDEPVAIRSRYLAATAAVPDILDCDACIGADDKVLMAIATELVRQGVPRDRWPAMVGFEALVRAENLVVSSVRPDWTMLGTMAADRLFDAARGRPQPIGATELAGMKLVRRPFAALGAS